MWLWTRTLALVLLLSLVSAGSLPHKNRNKIQYIDFDIPLVCHDEVFDRKRVSKIGKKACHRQSKFDNCGLINSCGLAKHHFAPDKYNGQIYSHECCYHMTWPFPMKKKNKGEQRSKFASTNLTTGHSGFTAHIDQRTDLRAHLQM